MSDQLADRHEASGKVREIYNFGETMLMVASDRMSAFDVIMPTPIPDKGRVLTALSAFWFERTAELAPNHLISIVQRDFPEPARSSPRPGRPHDAGAAADDAADRVRRARLPGRLRLEGLPRQRHGLRPAAAGRACIEIARLPQPIFTPATKADQGHDDQHRSPTPRRCWLATSSATRRSRGVSSTLYEHASAYAAERGIIIADTKFEFGIDATAADAGRRGADAGLVALLAGRRVRAGRPAAVVRQAVRARLARDAGWDKQPPPPELPDDVVAGTRARYLEAYQLLTGEPFSAYLRRNGVTP